MAFTGAIVLAIEPLDGGASNITCRLRLDGTTIADAVLRLQRKRGIFEPYNVLREGRVLAALWRTDVPVPRMLASEGHPDYLGAPFILMEWVDAPHMGVAGPDASFPAFAAMVAKIHQVDYEAAGLGFLLKRGSTVGTALAKELDIVARRMGRFVRPPSPLLERALALLRASIPEDGRLALCQGDINVFNYLFRKGEVVSVVDWEQARISDPRVDLGQLVALGHLKGAPFGPAEASPFIQLYAAVTSVPVTGLAWFRARWLWELGVIYHGWRAFNASDPWYSWDDLERLLEASLSEL